MMRICAAASQSASVPERQRVDDVATLFVVMGALRALAATVHASSKPAVMLVRVLLCMAAPSIDNVAMTSSPQYEVAAPAVTLGMMAQMSSLSVTLRPWMLPDLVGGRSCERWG